MKKQYFISVSFDGQPEIQCMILDSDETGLGLSADGITWCEQSDAQLYIDENNELMIKCINSSHISIERRGRKHILRADLPLRILPKDIIKIGETDSHTFNILHIYCSRKPLTLGNRLSKLAMIACATSMVMTCTVSCNRPEPNNPTDVIQLPDTTDDDEAIVEEVKDIQLDTPMLMGVVVRPENDELLNNKEEFVNEMKSNVIDAECIDSSQSE